MFKHSTLLLALAVSFSAFAQDEQKSEGQSTLKIDEAADQKNKVDGNIDEEITNAKLRAETGSKSKFSASFTANYYGGSLSKPADRNRPNPTREPIPPKTSMAGDFGVRYRMDKSQSIKLGTGYSLERPFHEAQRGQINNPAVSYNNAGKLGPVQSLAEAELVVSTNSDEVEIGQTGTLNLSETLIYDFGGSRFSAGLATTISAMDYTKRNELVQPKGAKRQAPALAYQEDYIFAAYPFAEYAVSDLIQLRTVFRPWIFSHERSQTQFWKFSRRPWTQSFGVGFAVLRDVYLYPNFQWDVERWRREGYSFAGKRTRESSTVGISATVNLF
ncbi:MAG: hypothetical protein AB7F86_19460 [Bdellovibrionales bacterium]